jgi:hypothetical protein
MPMDNTLNQVAVELEGKMTRWAKQQRRNHPTQKATIAHDLNNWSVLPCECSKCRQPRLTMAEAQLVAAYQECTAQHIMQWQGLE